MSAASFLYSSCLQAVNAVILWPVHVQKAPQASEHLCPAKLQTRCDICFALQLSAHSFPLTPACPGQQIHRSLCSRRLCIAVCQSEQSIPDSIFCRRFIESVRMMACEICASRWETRRCIAYVTAYTSMVRLEVVTL